MGLDIKSIKNVVGSANIFKASADDSQVFASQGPRLIPEDNRTKEYFSPPTAVGSGATLTFVGNVWAAARLDATGATSTGGSVFKVPHDFTSLISVHILMIPAQNNATADIDISVAYAANGEDDGTHLASDTASTYNFSIGDLKEIEITSLFGSLAVEDYVGVKVRNNEADNHAFLGVKLRYT